MNLKEAFKIRKKNATQGVQKNGVPLLIYLDIFKNFFANTQEDKFYMLKGIGEISFEVIDSYNNENEGHYIIGKDNTKTIKITNTTKLTANIDTKDYQSLWSSINVKVLNSKGTVISTSLSQMTDDATKKSITLNNIDANPFATILLVSTTTETKKFLKTELGQYDLKLLDQIRDVILNRKGNDKIILQGTELGPTICS
jgi:hypothetical protein